MPFSSEQNALFLEKIFDDANKDMRVSCEPRRKKYNLLAFLISRKLVLHIF